MLGTEEDGVCARLWPLLDCIEDLLGDISRLPLIEVVESKRSGAIVHGGIDCRLGSVIVITV